MRRLLLPLLALALCQPAAAATTRLDRHGTVVLDGRKVFPIALAKGPPAEGFAEVAAAGVNVLKVGPAGGWTADDLARTIAENRAAASHGLSTWVNLSAFAQLRPGGWRESLLRHVVGTLETDPSASAIALWKGADEPWRYRMRPASLRFAYCLATASVAFLVCRHAGGLRSPLCHRPGPARGRLVAGAVLRGHRHPRRQQLPDRDRRHGSRPRRARLVDEHPRPRHAEALGVDDARDLLDVELRRGRQRPAAERASSSASWSTTRS